MILVSEATYRNWVSFRPNRISCLRRSMTTQLEAETIGAGVSVISCFCVLRSSAELGRSYFGGGLASSLG